MPSNAWSATSRRCSPNYAFPPEHWDALRTTNPIERVNKEFKRRSKAMEVVSFDTDLRVCARCGGRLVIRAVVTDSASVAKLLAALRRPRAPPAAA